MPQAIHESTAFNSRNCKVAIHCVLSLTENTHWCTALFLKLFFIVLVDMFLYVTEEPALKATSVFHKKRHDTSLQTH